jgi:putative glutamine amidotransferase
LIVGITDNMRPLPIFENYLWWLRHLIPDLHYKKLSCVVDNLRELESCDALILSGGGDIHPKYYHREDAVNVVEEVNDQRDEFEFRVIDDAMRLRMPVLGICRGMQIFNVAMGGTMIPDIEAAGFRSHRKGDVDERLHPIQVEPGTILHAVTKTTAGTINTIHHQAVDRIGMGLRVSARSDDGIIEALEWEDPGRTPHLVLVQWHPERMKDFDNPFSRNIVEWFIGELQQSTQQRRIST